jgi:hypothetical protein
VLLAVDQADLLIEVEEEAAHGDSCKWCHPFAAGWLGRGAGELYESV